MFITHINIYDKVIKCTIYVPNVSWSLDSFESWAKKLLFSAQRWFAEKYDDEQLRAQPYIHIVQKLENK